MKRTLFLTNLTNSKFIIKYLNQIMFTEFMSEKTKKLTNDIGDLAELVIKSMILIVVVVLVARALLPILITDPIIAKYASYILGIAGLFVIIVSKEVRKEILNLGHDK